MRSLRLVLLVMVALSGLAACSSEPDADRPAPIDVSDAVVLDVRTAAEYAEGHLEGAVNLDVQDEASFTRGVGELDPDAAYVVYCRTGNRSAAASEILTRRGFTQVVDAGGIDEAAMATGLRVVTDDERRDHRST